MRGMTKRSQGRASWRSTSTTVHRLKKLVTRLQLTGSQTKTIQLRYQMFTCETAITSRLSTQNLSVISSRSLTHRHLPTLAIIDTHLYSTSSDPLETGPEPPMDCSLDKPSDLTQRSSGVLKVWR